MRKCYVNSSYQQVNKLINLKLFVYQILNFLSWTFINCCWIYMYQYYRQIFLNINYRNLKMKIQHISLLLISGILFSLCGIIQSQDFTRQEPDPANNPSYTVNSNDGSSKTASPQQIVQTFKVGDRFNIRAINGRIFVKINIGSQIQSKYLFVHLRPGSTSANIPIRIHIYQEGLPGAILSCVGEQVDSCFLHKNMLIPNSQLLILTESGASPIFDFTMSTYWSNLEHLVPNEQPMKFFFDKNDQTQLYHIQLKSLDFYELRIVIKPETVRSIFDKIKIYGKFGGQNVIPSPSDYDFKSIHLWEQAEGVFMYANEVKNKQITILIAGDIENIYQLSCEIIQDSHHDLQLGENIHEYLEPGQEFVYHVKFTQQRDRESSVNRNQNPEGEDRITSSAQLQFQEYVLSLNGYSGQLGAQFYIDQDLKMPLKIQPFTYLSDAQFIFKKAQLIANNISQGFFLYLKNSKRKSVYSLKLYGRNTTDPIKLENGVHEFLEIPVGQSELIYFQQYEWKNNTQLGLHEFSLTMTNVLGNHEIKFYSCLQQKTEICIDSKAYKSFTRQQEVEMSTIGTKTTYRIMLDIDRYIPINQFQKLATVVMVVSERKNTTNSGFVSGIVAVEYRTQNKIETLRQGKPVQTKIKTEQYKIFKFTNQDPHVKQAHVYVNQIAGSVEISSLREQPKMDEPLGKLEQKSVISFTEDLATKPVFLIVRGLEEAIFSLQLSMIHQSDNSYSTVTLSQDIRFSIKIKPQGFQVVEVIPIYDKILFQYKASGSMIACAMPAVSGNVKNETKYNSIVNAVCSQGIAPKLTNKGNIDIHEFSDRVQLFMLINPSQDETIQVNMIYHSRDYAHCEQKQLSVLYYDSIQKGQITQGGTGFQNNCVAFPILEQQSDLSLSISRVDIGQMHYAIFVCSQLFSSSSEVSTDNLQIPRKKISQLCSQASEKSVNVMFSPHKTETEQSTKRLPFKVKYLLESSYQKAISIPDGVSYDFEAKTVQSAVKVFYFDLINKKNTTVKLIQFLGKGQMSVYVVPTSQKQKLVSNNNYDYSFKKTESFFLNPTITITEKQLKNKNCSECSLVIKVYSKEDIGSKVHFGLEVSQNHIVLQDNKGKDGFLTKGSLDYYSFTTLSHDFDSSLIVEVNDNSRHCVSIYLSEADYPDSKNFASKEQGNQLIFEDAVGDKQYNIAVQGIEDCPYSITVSNTRVPITKLKRGQSKYLKLDPGQIKYFMIEHLEKREFKILSILQKGETYFYLNKTTAKNLQNLLISSESDALDLQKFQIRSQYPNRMVLHQNNSYLAQNSFYLIAVSSLAESTGYLFFGDSDTSIQIFQDSTINDFLSSAGETFTGEFHGEGKYEITLTVLVGKLSMKLTTKDKKSENEEKQLINKEYGESKNLYLEQFNLDTSDSAFNFISFFYKEPVRVQFKALDNQTVYSFLLTKKESSKVPDNQTQTEADSSSTTAIEKEQPKQSRTRYYNIQSGKPNLQNISSTQSVIISGTLNREIQEILYTADLDDRYKLSKLQIKGYLIGSNQTEEQTKLNITIVRNVMKIKFEKVKFEQGRHSMDYHIDIKSNDNLTLTAYQDSGVSLLTHDTDILVHGQRDFVLYPKGSILLDIFECKGTTKILYSHTKAALDKAQSSPDLTAMPNQPHAYKIVNPGNTFLRIKGDSTYMRWLQLDSKKETGMGYINYKAGQIQYEGSLLDLTVKWKPISKVKQTKTELKHVYYILIIGNSTQTLKQAINCQDYHSPDLLYFSYLSESNGQQQSSQFLTRDLNKKQIIDKYTDNQNLFINIVAEVELKLASIQDSSDEDSSEHYRFVYTSQQIPLQVFKKLEVAEKDIYIIGLIGAATLLLICLTALLCIKTICPLVQRLKQGNMMVQQNQNKSDDFDIVPPSSDRNQHNVDRDSGAEPAEPIESAQPTGTDDKLN